MKKKRWMAVALLMITSLGLAGCGSSMKESTEQYFSAVSSRLSGLSGSNSSSSEEKSNKTALETPGNLAVDEEGNYTFTGVENSSYYIVYMYDANGTEGDGYIQISDNIAEDGSGTYTGNLSDSMSFGYGDYRIEVVAYPEVTDEVYRKSEAASCEYLLTGTVAEPAYAYLWDSFSGTLSVQMTSIGDYKFTAYPELLEVVLTNKDDASDVINLTLEDLTLIDDKFIVSTTDVKKDATYDITASATWDELIVTNPSAETEVGTVTVSSKENAVSWGYGYCDTSRYSFLDYPMVAENFDLETGGSIGVWYSFTPYSSVGYSVQNAEATATWQEEYSEYFTATPTDTTDEALHAYSVEVADSNGNAVYMSDFGMLTEMEGPITGTLEIYEDGTFKLALDGREMVWIEVKGSGLNFAPCTVEGTWIENEDGTVTLNYDRSTAVVDEE